MPELPEVEAVRGELAPAMEGARFIRVIARRPDLRMPLPRDFVTRLEGTTVRALRRRAKYLLAELSSRETLLMHLGMSGSFRVQRNARSRRAARGKQVGEGFLPHDHVVFEMSSGATVVFNDPRRFGFMKLLDCDGVPSDRTLGALGPEPLGLEFTGETLARALKGRKTSLKSALSDQRIVAGLGNIYVCEALHRAGLSPRRKASTIATSSGSPRPQAYHLARAIQAVLNRAIANTQRAEGDDRFRVYDRANSRCPRRGCAGAIRRIVQGGRSTYFCPVCQR